jgi:hypothetical protein
MLVSCLDCGKRVRTEVSPLWFTCGRCLNKPMKYCDGCGEDFPRTHLEYVSMWDGYFCNSCCE